MQLLVSTAVFSGNFIGEVAAAVSVAHTWLLVVVVVVNDVDVVVIAFTLGLVLGSAALLTMCSSEEG